MPPAEFVCAFGPMVRIGGIRHVAILPSVIDSPIVLGRRAE